MKIFAVVGTDDPDQRAAIVATAERSYDSIYDVSGVLFVAVESDETTAEVARKLGIGDDKKLFHGIVIDATFNWGFHDKELWEWMRAKSNGK